MDERNMIDGKGPINSVEHKEEIMTLKIKNGTVHRVHTSCSGI